jgi:hypothetical protein
MIVLITGEIGLGDLEMALAELKDQVHQVIVIGSSKPIEPASPKLEDLEFLGCPLINDKEIYDMEQELDIPFRDRYHNRTVKLPPAPPKQRVFKPSMGRS